VEKAYCIFSHYTFYQNVHLIVLLLQKHRRKKVSAYHLFHWKLALNRINHWSWILSWMQWFFINFLFSDLSYVQNRSYKFWNVTSTTVKLQLPCVHSILLSILICLANTQRKGWGYSLKQYNAFNLCYFLCPRHTKNGGGALSVTPVRACVRACVRPSVCYQNLVSAQ